ncbi:MAG: type III secretion system inner membrane ring subunit SctD [Chlamydiota bacterium]
MAMAGFLIAEDEPLAGLLIRFEEGDEWVIGRDPDVSFQVIEDPMVSRKHVVCRLTDEGYLLENLSDVNPANVNGKPIDEPVLLQEGDSVQIGNVLFRFTLQDPAQIPSEEDLERAEEENPTIYGESDDLEVLSFSSDTDARWIIKVIAGPNAGAEFGLHQGESYILGKDSTSCDFIFQDLSVSRQHARMTVSPEGEITIEDLQSLNKVLVNGKEVTGTIPLQSQDLIALGTTSLLVIDREQTRETIISPSPVLESLTPQVEEAPENAEMEPQKTPAKNWKKLIIPMRHLVIAGVFVFALVLGIAGIFSLFKAKPVVIAEVDETKEINQALKRFPELEFSFNSSTGKLFILGHVMTEVDLQEVAYLLWSLPFIKAIDNNIIVDELIWENTNALLAKNPSWRGVVLSSIIPGHFVLRGYVQTTDQATKLSEYINLNFPYSDKLNNQVVVENTLEAQVQSILATRKLVGVSFQLANGELILTGRTGSNLQAELSAAVKQIQDLKGVRILKNFVILTAPISDVIDITSKYTVTGSSRKGNISQYVAINGRILSKGDTLDGMRITEVNKNTIFLEKDGIKYRIQYNQQ